MAFIDPDDEPQKRKFNDPDTKTSFTDRLKSVGIAGARGMVTGGPLGALTGASGEAANQGNEMAAVAGYDIGGSATDLAAKVLPPEAAAGVGFAANVATQAIPVLAGGASTSGLASPLAKPAARRLMQSALKPNQLARESGDAKRGIETLLKEGVNVSEGGVDALKGRIGTLNDEITKIIESSPQTVDRKQVGGYLNDAIKKFEAQVNPSSDVKVIESAWNEFLAHPLFTGDKIPVTLAQRMKQATYRVLDTKAFGELKGADIEAQKTLARGLKEEIAKAEPAVSGLNKRESDLINAKDLVESAVSRGANKDLVGLGWLNPMTVLPWLWDRSAIAKSMTARSLYSGGLPSTLGQAGGALYASEQMNDGNTGPGILYRNK